MIKAVVSADIGGTNTRIAIINSDGDILKRESFATPLTEKPEVLIYLLTQAIEEISKDRRDEIECCSISSAGYIKQPEGVIRVSPNFPEWKEVSFKAMLEDSCGKKVVLENDANCALLAECWIGSAKGCKNIILLTLGTGVGGGCLVDGQLLRGKSGYAGELGHITISFDGPMCGCSSPGHLEAFCSPERLKLIAVEEDQRYKEVKKSQMPEILYNDAVNGLAAAKEAWSQYGRRLGTGIATFLNIFNPEIVVLGGGLSKAYSIFEKDLKAEITKRSYGLMLEDCKITTAKFSDDAGLLGAAYLAFQQIV